MKISTRFRLPAILAPFFAVCPGTILAQDSAPQAGEWPTDGWASGDPGDHGMPADIAAQIDAWAAAQTPLLSALLVVRDGNLIVENYYGGFAADQTFLTWSIAKSVTSQGFGIAFHEGLVTNLNQPLGELIPDLIPANADPRVPSITLEHLLTSTSGWEWDGRINFRRHDETDLLDNMLARPMVCDPGACYEYDSTNSNLLSYIIQVQSGETMAVYLEPRLFEPLGISTFTWATTDFGATRGAGGLQMTPADVAKLGYLYLRNGAWDGQTIVDEEWVESSTTEQASGTSSISGVNIGGGGTYGYQWWIKEPYGLHAYYGNGYGGQTLYVVPELDLVVVTAVAGTDVNEPGNQQPVIPLIEELIVPAAIER